MLRRIFCICCNAFDLPLLKHSSTLYVELRYVGAVEEHGVCDVCLPYGVYVSITVYGFQYDAAVVKASTYEPMRGDREGEECRNLRRDLGSPLHFWYGVL